MMPPLWMVRAGEGGYLAAEFYEKGYVAIGLEGLGDLAQLESLDALRAACQVAYPDKSTTQIVLLAGVAHKFRSTIKVGDRILTYDPAQRLYHLGTVAGAYEYAPGVVTDYAHVRRVTWNSSVSRDVLTLASRNSLGSTITIFEPGPTVLQDLIQASNAPPAAPSVPVESVESREEVVRIYEDQLGRSHEFIKDRINRLDAREMEHLAAALLRALGFRARVTPGGPDRGRDVVASADGLGLQPPRILCEVKHRKGSMGAPEVRNFLAGLRSDDRGLYLSTGGFTKEAKYEAERATTPVTLLDLDDLARLVVEHYEQFDTAGRALIPLERIYWPVPKDGE